MFCNLRINYILFYLIIITLCTKYDVYYNANKNYEMEEKNCKSTLHINFKEQSNSTINKSSPNIKAIKPKTIKVD